MTANTLEATIAGIRSDWGPLSTEVVSGGLRHLTDLLQASPSEEWLSALHREAPANRELYRDPEHGFVLLAHTEHAGLYRPPHDHGRGWVIYAMQRGEIEMRTYARIEDPDGSVNARATGFHAGPSRAGPGLFAGRHPRHSVRVRSGAPVSLHGAGLEAGGQGGAPSHTLHRAGRRLDRGIAVSNPLAIASVLAAMVLVVLDAAIANVALPTIAASMHVTPAMSVWVITAYQTALVMALLPAAALGETYGYRRVFTMGVALFTAASGLCALSPSLPWLVAARFIQGIGGAAVMALGVALLRFVVQPKQLGAAIGWNALAVALASAAGPAIGAAILSSASWPLLFAVNLPLGLLVLLASRALPQVEGNARRPDLTSVLLNAGAFAALVVGAELLPARPVLAITLILVAILAGTALVRRESVEGRAADPVRPAPCRLISNFNRRLGPAFLGRCRWPGGAAFLPAARARAERMDDRALHDAVAADGGDRGPASGATREPRVDGMAVCRGRRGALGRAGWHRAVAVGGAPITARDVDVPVRPRFRTLSGTQQPQHVPRRAARAKRRGGRHAGHRATGGSGGGRSPHDLALHSVERRVGVSDRSRDRGGTDAVCRHRQRHARQTACEQAA